VHTSLVVRVLDTASRVFWRPQVLALSAASVIGGHLAFAALGAERGFWYLPPPAMALLVLVVLGQGWITLCVSATALALARAHRAQFYARRPSVVWVPPTTAFEAGCVSLVLALPTLACLLFLIVPGFVLALRWSQTVMVILDGRTTWLESAEESALITRGRRLDILLLWALVAALFLGVAGVQVDAPPVVDSILHVGATTFSLAVLAATYGHLTADES
jgi:hypothetical protein